MSTADKVRKMGLAVCKAMGASLEETTPPEATTLAPAYGKPCAHAGCLNHVSHPCEGCGRTAGRSNK